MAWMMVATPSFASIEQVDAVLAQLDGAPDGMEERYLGTADDGELRVVSLWQSKAHAHRFFAEELGPAVAKALGPEPVGASDILGIDVQRSYVRQPVAGDATPAEGRTSGRRRCGREASVAQSGHSPSRGRDGADVTVGSLGPGGPPRRHSPAAPVQPEGYRQGSGDDHVLGLHRQRRRPRRRRPHRRQPPRGRRAAEPASGLDQDRWGRLWVAGGPTGRAYVYAVDGAPAATFSLGPPPPPSSTTW